MISITLLKNLQTKDIPKNKGWEEQLLIEEDLLDNEDYKIYDIELIDNNVFYHYQLIHGFPGDNPCGIIVDSDNNILDTCGEVVVDYEGNDNTHKIKRYYDKITNGCTDYAKLE